MNLQQWFQAPKVVEIHCHCLPGLDDGPASWDEALELCRAMALQGISEVIATPHQLGLYDGRNPPALVRRRVDELNVRLVEQGLDMRVHPGGDVRIDERMTDLLAADQVLTLADAGQYLLLELFSQIAVDPQPLLLELLRQNIIPIISHPERYPWVARRPQYVTHWLNMGVGIQITAGALTGDFGSATQSAAWQMLGLPGLVMVASDAHDTVRRPPRLMQAAQLIAQQWGRERAKMICIHAPVRVMQAIGATKAS